MPADGLNSELLRFSRRWVVGRMAIDLVGMSASRRVGCLRSDAFWPRLGLGWRSREFEQNDAPRFQTDTAETLPAYSTTGRWDHGTCGPAGGASNVESGVHVRFALVQIQIGRAHV